MRKLLFLLLLSAVIFSCQQKKEVTINLSVKDKAFDHVNLIQETADTSVMPDETGKAVIVAKVEEPQYAVLNYKWKRLPVYLEPGKDFTATWDMTPSGLEISFEGEGGDINSFINSKELKIPVMSDFNLPEEEFMEKMDQYVAENYKKLESKGFDKAFVEKEKQRINYDVYGILWQYARRQAVSDAFYAKIKGLMVEEPWMLQLASYSNYMQGAVNTLALKGEDELSIPVHERVMRQLNYTLENIKEPKIKEYLIASFAYDYVDSEGVDEAEDINKIFEENVTDPQMRAAYRKIYDEGSMITKGKKSINFKYKDINGKEVSLDDLKGNLVYIDVWATWCGPCREEIPHLQKLEEMFKDMKIKFVSISTDQNKDAWEKMVREEKLGGIQLHAGTDESFVKAYRINGIPRFILLDQEGRILEANMSRPSKEETVQYLAMYAEPVNN